LIISPSLGLAVAEQLVVVFRSPPWHAEKKKKKNSLKLEGLSSMVETDRVGEATGTLITRMNRYYELRI
jgi:hypothetical protein